jgi:peptide/nickel transport system substrate-binding protein
MMSAKPSRFIRFLLFAFLVVSSSLAVTAQGGGELSVGISNNVDTLDANVTTFSSVGIIASHVYDPLVWQSPLGTFNPGLATEWTINENATEYTFKLREDVTFHDGTPFNAAAVKYTFDRIANPDTGAQTAFSLLGPYQETEIVDDYTVIVRFSTPYAPFLDSAASPYLGMTSQAAVDSLGADYGLTSVVSTGPFKVESYIPDSEVVLVKNPDYNWGSEVVFGQSGAANLDKITFKLIIESTTRLAALESGEVQFINDLPPLDVARLMENPDITVSQIEQPGHGWSLMFNQEKAPTDELAVRQAIAQAINKQAFIDIVFNGFGTPGCSPLTKVMFAYTDASCQALPYDPAAAAATLEAAGWIDSDGDGIRERDGVPLVIEHWYRDNPLSSNMATTVQADLAVVGIQFNTNGADGPGYFEKVRAGEHNTQNWWDTFTDPGGVVRTLFHSSNADGGTNRNRYRNEEMDSLIDQAAGTSDAAARAELYAQIQQKVADEAIMVFMNDPYLLYGSAATLEGVVYLSGGNIPNFYAATLGS